MTALLGLGLDGTCQSGAARDRPTAAVPETAISASATPPPAPMAAEDQSNPRGDVTSTTVGALGAGVLRGAVAAGTRAAGARRSGARAPPAAAGVDGAATAAAARLAARTWRLRGMGCPQPRAAWSARGNRRPIDRSLPVKSRQSQW